jgi:uncharacterized membrane protein YbhN (UPF0104 family)
MGATVWVAARVGASPGDLIRIPLAAHLLALAAMTIEMGARAARIRLLAGALEVPLRFRTALRAQFAADAAGAVTPSKVGADPAKIWIMGADGASLGGRGAVILGEMAWEAVVLLFVALGLALFAPIHRAVPLAILSYAGMVFVLASLAIWAARSAGSDPPGWWTTLRLTPARWRSLQEQGRAFIGHAVDLRKVPWTMNLGILASTVAHMAARVLVLGALVQGWTGIPEGGLTALVLWPFALLYLGTLLPPPGGGGVLEVSFASALGGVLGPSVLPAALLWWRVYTYYLPAAVGGLVLMAGRPRKTAPSAAAGEQNPDSWAGGEARSPGASPSTGSTGGVAGE